MLRGWKNCSFGSRVGWNFRFVYIFHGEKCRTESRERKTFLAYHGRDRLRLSRSSRSAFLSMPGRIYVFTTPRDDFTRMKSFLNDSRCCWKRARETMPREPRAIVNLNIEGTWRDDASCRFARGSLKRQRSLDAFQNASSSPFEGEKSLKFAPITIHNSRAGGRKRIKFDLYLNASFRWRSQEPSTPPHKSDWSQLCSVDF